MNLSFTICDDNKEHIEDIKNTIEQLGKKLKDLYPDITLVFITSYVEYAVKGYEAKADRYLLKPISLEVAEVAVSI